VDWGSPLQAAGAAAGFLPPLRKLPQASLGLWDPALASWLPGAASWRQASWRCFCPTLRPPLPSVGPAFTLWCLPTSRRRAPLRCLFRVLGVAGRGQFAAAEAAPAPSTVPAVASLRYHVPL